MMKKIYFYHIVIILIFYININECIINNYNHNKILKRNIKNALDKIENIKSLSPTISATYHILKEYLNKGFIETVTEPVFLDIYDHYKSLPFHHNPNKPIQFRQFPTKKFQIDVDDDGSVLSELTDTLRRRRDRVKAKAKSAASENLLRAREVAKDAEDLTQNMRPWTTGFVIKPRGKDYNFPREPMKLGGEFPNQGNRPMDHHRSSTETAMEIQRDDFFCRHMSDWLLDSCDLKRPTDMMYQHHCDIVQNTYSMRCTDMPLALKYQAPLQWEAEIKDPLGRFIT